MPPKKAAKKAAEKSKVQP